MLHPQSNLHRQVFDLSGFWKIRFDPEDAGLENGWQTGFGEGRPVAVPASWNDQFEDGRDFLGPAWYQTGFSLSWGWNEKRILLRFGSVNYLAEVWLNGQRLGMHEGGHLPFEFDVTPFARPAGNHLAVRVDGRLAFDRVPPGNVTGTRQTFSRVVGATIPKRSSTFSPIAASSDRFCCTQHRMRLCVM